MVFCGHYYVSMESARSSIAYLDGRQYYTFSGHVREWAEILSRYVGRGSHFQKVGLNAMARAETTNGV